MTGHRYRFTGPTRVVRGLVLGSAVLLLTAVAHTAASGTSPTVSLPTLAWLLPLTATLSVLAADRRRSLAWLVAYLLGMQALLHLLLVVGGGHHSAAATLVPSPPMVVTHVVAGLAAAVILTRADAVLHRWLRFLDCLSKEAALLVAVLPAASGNTPSRLFRAGGRSDVGRALAPQRRGPPQPVVS